MAQPHTKYDRVVGSCFACGGPVRASEAQRRTDRGGIRRLLHPGLCSTRFDWGDATTKIEGGTDGT